LESLHIMATTKNIDTLKGRFEFINKFYNNFIQYAKNKRYTTDIQEAIDTYKVMYYDKIINDLELALLINPNYENLNEFYLKCLYESFKEYVFKQEEEIYKLKTDKAKNRRIEKIIFWAKETINEIKAIDNNKSNQYISDINKIINNYDIR